MAKNPNKSLIYALVIVVLAVLAFAGYSLSLSHSTTNAAINTAGSCPSNGQAGINFGASYVNTQGVVVPVSTSANVFITGQTSQWGGVSSTPSVITIPCYTSGVATSFWGTYGDNINYYKQVMPTVSVGNTGNVSYKDNGVLPIVVPSYVSFSNGIVTSTNYALFPSGQLGAGAGRSVPYTIYGASTGVFGNNKVEAVLAYNGSEYSSVALTGTGVTSVTQSLPSAISGNILTGYTPVAYTIPSVGFGNSSTYTIAFQVSTLNANSLVANPIQLILVDGTTIVVNGQPQLNAFTTPLTNVKTGAGAYQTATLAAPLTSGAGNTNILSPAVVVYK
jgi:hypothetical protein